MPIQFFAERAFAANGLSECVIRSRPEMSAGGQGLPFRVRWKHVGSTPDKLTTFFASPTSAALGQKQSS
jgi:hypothetical protein